MQECLTTEEAPRKIREVKDEVKDKLGKLVGPDNFNLIMEFYSGEDRHEQELLLTCSLSKLDRSELHILIARNLTDVASKTVSENVISVFRQHKRQKVAQNMNKKTRY